MNIRRITAITVAVVVTGLAATGCASHTTTAPAVAKPHATVTATPASPVTQAADPTPTVTAHPDQNSIDTFGATYVNDKVLTDVAETVLGATLWNPRVIAGTQKPADAVMALPLQGKALTVAKAHPTYLTMDTFGTPVAPYTQPVGRVQVTDYRVAKQDGVDALRVVFTGHTKVFVAEKPGLVANRTYTLWLVKSTDTGAHAPKWFIAGFHGSAVKWTGGN